MLNLSDALTKARAATESLDPWIILLDITLPDESVIYVCRNTENLDYNGNTYIAVGFDIDFGGSQEAGNIPNVTLKLFNAPELAEQLDDLGGGVGAEVKLSVVLFDNIGQPYSEDFSELELFFDVLQVTATREYISILLGMPSPMRQRHPRNKYMANFCRWKFKGIECGYTGVETACPKTLAACRDRDNSHRFGGFAGLSGKGVRVV